MDQRSLCTGLCRTYMIILHTVVHGWVQNKKNPYKTLISRSMMKFQGRQTVNNLLVSTVLIAGGCFGLFFLPMMGSSQLLDTKTAHSTICSNTAPIRTYRRRQRSKNLPGNTIWISKTGAAANIFILRWTVRKCLRTEDLTTTNIRRFCKAEVPVREQFLRTDRYGCGCKPELTKESPTTRRPELIL